MYTQHRIKLRLLPTGVREGEAPAEPCERLGRASPSQILIFTKSAVSGGGQYSQLPNVRKRFTVFISERS